MNAPGTDEEGEPRAGTISAWPSVGWREDRVREPRDLIVLAAKGGLDIAETRASYPRIAEVPFDSDYKSRASSSPSPWRCWTSSGARGVHTTPSWAASTT
jgi:hypothetical protein